MTPELARLRARLRGATRAFFERRGFLEVETPCLVEGGSLDPHVHLFEVPAQGGRALWLRSSPEHALKRLMARDLPVMPVLCSDTTVALDQQILGKPVDAEDALRTLTQLAGRRHRVITAVAVGLGERRAAALSISEVDFAAVDAARLRRYVESGEPFGKAGSYAIQSEAATWISRISGSYSGIMGLPLYETAEVLKQFGIQL